MFQCVFLSPLKSTLLATKNLSPPAVFDLGGWNRHFVWNWIAYGPRLSQTTFWIFDLFLVKTCNTNKKMCEYCIYKQKIWFVSQIFSLQKFTKSVCDGIAMRHVSLVYITNSLLLPHFIIHIYESYWKACY